MDELKAEIDMIWTRLLYAQKHNGWNEGQEKQNLSEISFGDLSWKFGEKNAPKLPDFKELFFWNRQI